MEGYVHIGRVISREVGKSVLVEITADDVVLHVSDNDEFLSVTTTVDPFQTVPDSNAEKP